MWSSWRLSGPARGVTFIAHDDCRLAIQQKKVNLVFQSTTILNKCSFKLHPYLNSNEFQILSHPLIWRDIFSPGHRVDTLRLAVTVALAFAVAAKCYSSVSNVWLRQHVFVILLVLAQVNRLVSRAGPHFIRSRVCVVDKASMCISQSTLKSFSLFWSFS